MDLVRILPEPIAELPEAEQAARATISSDLCSLDDEHYFVRAVLHLPILKTGASLGFGVWGSLAKVNFNQYADEFDNPAPAFGPFFSWLCSYLRPYPDTSRVKAMMEFQPNNRRPVIRLEPTDHPLAIDQRNGITLDRLGEIYAAWGHTIEI